VDVVGQWLNMRCGTTKQGGVGGINVGRLIRIEKVLW